MINSEIFNHQLLLLRRRNNAKKFLEADFLYQSSNEELIFKIQSIDNIFSNILELGYRNDMLKNQLSRLVEFNKYIAADDFEEIGTNDSLLNNIPYDLVISSLNFHYLNHPQQLFSKLKNLMKEKSVLVFSLFGNETLLTIRELLIKCQLGMKNNNFIDRVIPMIHPKDLTSLLQISGFKEIVVDIVSQNIEYQNFDRLINDLRIMSENNCMFDCKKYFGKNLYFKCKQEFEKSNKIVKVEIIYATATL
jgi:SAM-dependent methyltransferase